MGAEAEQQRHQADAHPGEPGPRQTPMTEVQFLSWKRQKDTVAAAGKAEAARKRAEAIAAGLLQMNGRELFLNEPWVFDNTLY